MKCESCGATQFIDRGDGWLECAYCHAKCPKPRQRSGAAELGASIGEIVDNAMHSAAQGIRGAAHDAKDDDVFREEKVYKNSIVGNMVRKKSLSLNGGRLLTGLAALVFGGFGVHRFLTGRIASGIFYLLFCWIGIPSVVGVVEGIIYLCRSDAEFEDKYLC